MKTNNKVLLSAVAALAMTAAIAGVNQTEGQKLNTTVPIPSHEYEKLAGKEPTLVSVNSSSLQVEPIYSTKTLKQKIESALDLTVYSLVPFNEGRLVTAFTTKGTYVIDANVNFAFKGRVIDLKTGDNVLANQLKQVESEIKTKISKRNSIQNFTKSTNDTALVKSAVGKPETDLRGVPTMAGTVKDNTLKPTFNAKSAQELANNQILMHNIVKASPGAQLLLERDKRRKAEKLEEQRQDRVLQEYKAANASVPSTNKALEPKKESLIDVLKNLDPAYRKQHGPEFSPALLPIIPDNQFIVYQESKDVPYKGTLTVATDFTCPVCKQLHNLIPTLNAEGVKVRYMPYPRSRITDYQFSDGFTIDQYIYRTKTEELNQLGQLVSAGYCSTDNTEAYDELFSKKSVSEWPQTISESCEGKVREFKVLGDLLFSGSTPYMVWGNADTPEEDRGFIRGLHKTDKSIEDLLKRKQS
ncbi:hypothetical protein F7Q91_03450 [Vibrio chagasii]|uniref:Thioredoxin-like fold domain-containing protein n=1 Tax=Vibrio chagasii TaxID=170679 RepID=A0A7V7NX61_9VIBR|nr:hypothetical protein [Vibrio chagasii]KAB0482478.1 hypothetical protein F7Q91_03450 [Vibrio chagasii]